MFQKIWEQNKRFILIAGSGFALFLILNSCVSSFSGSVDGPKGLYARSYTLERDIRRMQKDLSKYSELKGYLAAYQTEESALRADLELSVEPETEKFDEAAPLLQFERAIDRVWGLVQERANKANVACPERLESKDFGAGRQDRRPEFERHYAYLGIVRRAMMALIESGATEIGRPELVEPDILPVLPNDDSIYCLFRAVRFRVAGPFEAFLRVLQAVQEPRSFLQVRIVSMAPKKKEEDQTVAGELNFVGFWLVDKAQLAGEETGRGGRRPSRRK